MGRQIQIAQSPKDEIDFVAWVSTRHNILSAPSILDEPALAAVPLGQCDAPRQLLFPIECYPLFQQRITALLGDQSKYQVSPAVADGRCLEWCRTPQPMLGHFVVGGAFESRFYFQDDPAKGESRLLNRLVDAIFTYVRSNYPLITETSPPRYVGHDLSEMLEKGTARLCHPNGQALELSRNPAALRRIGT